MEQGRPAPWPTSLTPTITYGIGAGQLLQRWKEKSKEGQSSWWWAQKSRLWLRACSWRRLVASVVIFLIFVEGRINVLQQRYSSELFFGPKMHIFGNYLLTSYNFLVTIMTGHQKGTVFVLNPLHGERLGGRRGQYLARKSSFFYATPILSQFFGVRKI